MLFGTSIKPWRTSRAETAAFSPTRSPAVTQQGDGEKRSVAAADAKGPPNGEPFEMGGGTENAAGHRPDTHL